MLKRIFLFTSILLGFVSVSLGQSPASWDSLKTITAPLVTPAFTGLYAAPYRQPLGVYGWEDGIHISRDGLSLYALYSPSDIVSWNLFVATYGSSLAFCDLTGNTDFRRSYAPDLGMDLVTNSFGCDSFFNIDIVFAHRNTTADSFVVWQLSSMARPGRIEGGSMPLPRAGSSDSLDIFLFTENNDIWMLRNMPLDPDNVASAVRLPSPINPIADEFSADNPHLERMGGDTLLLVYERNEAERNFFYSYSYDDGLSWTMPLPLTNINALPGHIEHPHLWQSPIGIWHLWFSNECEIYRAEQATPGDWSNWLPPQKVIAVGSAACVGEPSVMEDGSISFAVVYDNAALGDTSDRFDIDPWFLPALPAIGVEGMSFHPSARLYPNPSQGWITLESEVEMSELRLMDLSGQMICSRPISGKSDVVEVADLLSGLYLAVIIDISGNVLCRQRLLMIP